MIKKIIALILVPFIFIITNELTSIKDTKTLSFNIEENNTLTTDTYNNLLTLKDNKNYSINRTYNITNEDLETSRLKIDDTVKNEIVDNTLIENVSLIDLSSIEKTTVNDKHYFYNFISSYNIKQLNQVYTDLNLIENVNTLNITSEKLADVTIYGKSMVKVKQSELDIANQKVNDTIKNELIYTNSQATISEKVGKVTFNGSENWLRYGSSEPSDFTTIAYYFEGLKNSKISSSETNTAISNYLTQQNVSKDSYTYDKEGFMIIGNFIYIRLLKTKLSSLTISQYLTQNPLTIYYQLAVQNPKEKVIQDSDIFNIVYNTNVDIVTINKPTDSIMFNNIALDKVANIEGFSELLYSDRNNIDNIVNIGKFYTYYSNDKFFYIVAKGTTLQQAKDLLRNKKLTYQLTTPRYALTEGIQDTINPKIKSTSPTSQTAEIQFNETLASIPNTSITDEIKPLTNGQYEVTKKVKTVKLWEEKDSDLYMFPSNTINDMYVLQFMTFKTRYNLSNSVFVNTFPFADNSNNYRHSRYNPSTPTAFQLFIEKDKIDGTIASAKNYLQLNNITFKGELANYEKYITTPTGNNLLELYPNGTVYTDSPIKLNYTDYTKPNSTINGNYSLFKNHLYYTGELQAGLLEINQTTKPVNTYEITNSTIKYDVITKKIILDINDSYNSIEISPNDNFKDLSGYELINNNYELTYYIYQIQDPYIREFIKIVPMIYIGVVLIYILMFKERG